MMLPERTLAKFWGRVVKSETGCWEWTGAKHEFGYGCVCIPTDIGKRTVRAHRLSWELANGPIPAGLIICHKCDNPSCVRPDHLFLGTKADNTNDMMRKRRHRCVPLKGERHGNAKLTNASVREIRARYASGGITQTQLAKEYGALVSTINNIVLCRQWRDV